MHIVQLLHEVTGMVTLKNKHTTIRFAVATILQRQVPAFGKGSMRSATLSGVRWCSRQASDICSHETARSERSAHMCSLASRNSPYIAWKATLSTKDVKQMSLVGYLFQWRAHSFEGVDHHAAGRSMRI